MAKLYIACDHAGYKLKEHLKPMLAQKGYQVQDLGTENEDSVDYPDYAKRVAQAVLQDDVCKGILICGTGIGMSIAANKFQGIRAALCRTEFEAQMARNHNNANVICVGARAIQDAVAERVVTKFCESEFEGGRHQKRLDKVAALES